MVLLVFLDVMLWSPVLVQLCVLWLFRSERWFAEQNLARPLRRSRCTLGDRADQTNKEQKKKTFNTKPLKTEKKRRALTLAPHWTRPICFVPSYLPLPSAGEPLGAILAPVSLPWPPFSPQPLKSCTAMCMALMFALYPTCKAIIIHASWQSQPRLCYICSSSPWATTWLRLISPLLHIAPRVSLSLRFSLLQTLYHVWVWLWFDDLEIFYLSASVTPPPLWSVSNLVLESGKNVTEQDCVFHNISQAHKLKSYHVINEK